MAEKHSAVPASYVLLEKEGKYLISRRRNTSYYEGFYGLPSGHIEEGELPTIAACREAKEEIGVDIDPKDLELIHIEYRTKNDETGDRVDFFFKVKAWSGEVTNMEPDKCDDLRWESLDTLPENIIPQIKDALESIKNGVQFRELGRDFFGSLKR